MGQLRTFLVINPHSANGATGRRLEHIRAAVRRAIGPFEDALTGGPMEAAALARGALDRGFECVVAVGGDGTLNEVVNGFFDGERPVNPRAAVGVVPSGTGGDFRRAFGWSASLDESCRRLAGDATRPIDVGRIEFLSPSGEAQARCFLNIASAGASGRVDFEVNRATKALGGRASFALGTFRAMLSHRDFSLRLTLDGGPARPVTATLLAAANGQYFGGGMRVAPDARLDDGLLDVTLWTGLRLRDFILRGRLLYDGRHVQLPQTQRFRARQLSLESDAEVLLDVDGEQPGKLPARFSVLPGALKLKV